MAASPNPTLVSGFQALRPVTHQKVAYTGTHGAISNAVTSTVVRIVCTSAAHLEFAVAPAAVAATDMYVAANVPEYFVITPGHKVSAIQATAGGDLHVTEMD